MHCDHLHASPLSGEGQAHRIFVRLAPACAHLQGDRHAVGCAGSDHRLNNGQGQRLILHQCRAGPGVAYLLGGTPHVDVNDLGAAVDVVARCISHHGWLGTRNLHRNRTRLTLVVKPARSLERSPQVGSGGHHFTDCVSGAELATQLAKGPICHARHGCNKKPIGQYELAKLHWIGCKTDTGGSGVLRRTEVWTNSSRAKSQQLK